MFEIKPEIVSFFSSWENIKMVFIIVSAIILARYSYRAVKNNPIKALSFIEKAGKEGNIVTGIMCYHSVFADKTTEAHVVEYMYVVDGKTYYATYEINPNASNGSDGSDELLEMLNSKVQFYYDKNDPSKIMHKYEIACTKPSLRRIKKKKNMKRTLDRDWLRSPIIE